MKQGLAIIFLCSVGVLELTGAPTQHKIHHGTVTPKLTLVAMVDGKAFFLDQTIPRNRTEALNYCTSLGMQLAEITSVNQYLALDQAVVANWTDSSFAWTGGIEVSGIRRYVWNNSNVGLDPAYIPYLSFVKEDSDYFVQFFKVLNYSRLTNSVPSALCSGVLCETLPTSRPNLW